MENKNSHLKTREDSLKRAHETAQLTARNRYAEAT
jgi:hypothetical protein